MTKAVSNLMEIIPGTRPEEVAAIAIARAVEHVYCAVLDLGQLKLTPKAAIPWLEQYNRYVAALAPEHGVRPPYPKVAILGRNIDLETTRCLRELGAVVFDSAGPSYGHLTGLEAFAEEMRSHEETADQIRHRSENVKASHTHVPTELDEENRRFLNSYPEGVTHEHLTEMLARLNREM